MFFKKGSYFPVSKSRKFSHFGIFNHMPLTNGTTTPVTEECCACVERVATGFVTITSITDLATLAIEVAGVQIGIGDASGTVESLVADLINSINNTVTVPDYTASAGAGNTIVFSAEPGSGSSGNGRAITVVTAGGLGAAWTGSTSGVTSGGLDYCVSDCCIEDHLHSIAPASLNGPFFKRNSIEHAIG